MLRISEAASLAFHTMAYLARNPARVATTREIAKEVRGSEAHLSKVLQRLVKAGLVRSARGPKGGFSLGKARNDIRLLDIYETIEGPFQPKNCLLDFSVCGDGPCILGGMVEMVNREFKEYLAGTLLSDLIQSCQGVEPGAEVVCLDDSRRPPG